MNLLKLGYIGIFLVGLIESSVFPLSTLPLMTAGTVYKMSPYLIALVALLGDFIGASIVYYIGYNYGYKAVSRFVSEDKFRKTEALFHRYGVFAILIGEPFYVINWIAGILRFGYYRFITMALLSRTLKLIAFAFFGKALERFL